MRMFGGNLSIAQHWLNEPAIAFNGMRPLDLVAEGNIELLRDCLIRLEYGVYM
ncbi:antitoxin Xre/MbcA/ParS toxin-binding domain-containing protein [Massilia forsythiae]